ncbi:MAG: ankyrin repeat domain-containing protein, partial [Myxococcota bacterium]
MIKRILSNPLKTLLRTNVPPNIFPKENVTQPEKNLTQQESYDKSPTAEIPDRPIPAPTQSQNPLRQAIGSIHQFVKSISAISQPQASASLFEEVQQALVRGDTQTVIAKLPALKEAGLFNKQDSAGLSLWMRAAALGHLDVLKEAYAMGADLQQRTPAGATFMHFAAQSLGYGAGIARWFAAEAPEQASTQINTTISGGN